MKKILRRILAFTLTFALLFGLFPPIELDFGDGIKLDLGGSGLSVPVSAAFVDGTTFFDGTLVFTYESSNDSACTPFSVVTTNSAVKAASRNARAFSNTTGTTTLRMTNNCGKKATLAFTYAFTIEGGSSSNGTISITSTGTINDSSGNCSVVLENGGHVDIKITSKGFLKSYDNYVNVTGISLTPVADAAEVTFEYDSAKGSIQVDGSTVASGASVAANADGLTATATPKTGYVFWRWQTDAGYDYNNPLTIAPSGNTTVKAEFIGENTAVFGVGTDRYTDLNAAAAAAASGSTKTVVLLNNGTLPAGNYTIPSGVTLLIPYNANNSIHTNVPNCVSNDPNVTSATPTMFRTLTMEQGANLIVNGSLNVGGSQNAVQRYNGTPTGPVGRIHMEDGSTITISNNATLYAWGYITGAGNVTAKSGATVYESFQLTDFRGGSALIWAGIANNEYAVFCMSQYYIQNIEVKLTLEAGATEKAYMSTNAGGMGIHGTEICMISSGTDAMFQLTAGSITKDFIESTGRLEFEIINATVSVNPIDMSLNMGITMGGTTEINSADYNLPIPGHMSVKATGTSKVSINQDLALLPGSVLEIGTGVECTLVEGTRVIVYDWDDWGGYCSEFDSEFRPLPYAPGRANGTETVLVNGVATAVSGVYVVGRANTDATVIINGTIYAQAGAVYTTSGGANIYSAGTGKIVAIRGEETITYQVKQVDTEVEEYSKITIISAILQNGDGTTLETDGLETGKTYGFEYDSQSKKWVCVGTVDTTTCVGHTPGAAATCTTAQSCTVCGTVITAALGHTEETIAGKAATCTETGLTEGKKCTVCGEVTVAQTEIAVLGHSYDNACDADCNVCGATRTISHDWVDADCDTPKTCSVCKITEGEALGHKDDDPKDHVCDRCTANVGTHADSADDDDHVCDYGCGTIMETCTDASDSNHICDICKNTMSTCVLGETEAKNPTCTVAGHKNYYTCGICKKNFSDSSAQNVIADLTTWMAEGGDGYIPALGHTEVVDAAKAPTCTETGLTEGKHCSVCGEILVAQQTVDALGHTEVIDAAVAATCTATGLTEGKHCSVCNEVLVAQEVVKALGHTEVVDAAKAPTCTETGLTEGKHCSVCGEILVAQTEVAALGHSYDNDCDADCNVCGATRTPADHVYGTEWKTDETKHWHECACGAKSEEAAHSDVDTDDNHSCDICEKENVTEHDYSESWTVGDTTHWYACNCGAKNDEAAHSDVETDNNHSCDACGKILTTEHTYTLDTTKGVDGYTWIEDGKSCTAHGKCNCGATTTAEATVAGLITEQATCLAMGTTTYTATFEVTWATTQNKAVKDVAKNPNNHVQSRTYTDNGDTHSATYSCCGTEIVESHSYSNGVCVCQKKQTFTVTLNGNEYVTFEGAETVVYGAEYTVKLILAQCCSAELTGDILTSPIIVTTGTTGLNAHCKYENGVLTIPVNLITGDVTITVKPVLSHTWVNADCDTPKTCSVCKATEGEALGHDWSDATCTAPKTCKTCGETEGEANGHDWTAATCTAPKTCSVCGATEGEALGHTDGHAWGTPLDTAYVWSKDGKTCIATRVCKNDASHTETAQAVVTVAGIIPPTCTEQGTTTYEATFSVDWALPQIMDVQDSPATGHSYENGFCTVCNEYEPAVLNGDVYEISNAGQLYWFAQEVNKGNTTINSKLMTDIVINENVLGADGKINSSGNFRDWTPISNAYSGTFDGNHHTISGMISRLVYRENAMFLQIAAVGMVKNLGLVDSYFGSDEANVGSIAVSNKGTITNCFNAGTVSTSEFYAGGIVTFNSGIIENCYNIGTVKGSRMMVNGSGGITASNSGIIRNCYNIGSVRGLSPVGAVAGSNSGTISNTYYLTGCAIAGAGEIQFGVGYDYLTESPVVDVAGCTTGMTTEQFASGEVAYLLGDAFGQTIGADPYPTLSGAKVYRNQIVSCGDTSLQYVYSNTQADPITRHSYTAEVTAPTCTEKGYTTYTCVCGDSYVDDYTEATGHDYASVVTVPTCTEKGYTTYTCSDCGDSYTDNEVAATGHADGTNEDCKCDVCGTPLEHAPGDAATCTTAQTCTVCGEMITAALGHDWTAADCDTPKTCSVCGETEGEANGHDWKDATCTDPKTCSVCGETEGEANGHDWTDATCTDPKTCSVCGETEGEALGHTHQSYSYDDDQHWSICGVCGETFDKAAHTFGDDHKCACGAQNFWVDCSENIQYSIYKGTVTVTHGLACKAGYLDGGKYVEILATANDDGSYSFSAPEGKTSIVIVVIGDVDGNGLLEMADKTLLDAYLADPENAPLNEIQKFAADVNGNGAINSVDRILLARAVMSTTNSIYKPFAWKTGEGA